MQQSDAPGSAPIKARRPRKIAGLGAAAEQAKRWQDLGDALDALVRALGASDALAAGLSRRVHTLWRGDNNAVLEWHPTELRGEGRLVLAADQQRGRFVLPAYAAGLRMLAIREQSVAADVLRLAAKLGELERGALTPDAFADWLWRGCALGFDVAQSASASEIGAALLRSERPALELWGERSAMAVALWNELSWSAAQHLEASALSQRFGAPLAALERRAVQDRALALGQAEAQALRALADEPVAWARAETGLLFACQPLAHTMPLAHVTFSLLAIVECSTRFDPALLDAVAALEAAPGREGEAIDTALLGTAFGRMLLAHGFEDGVLHDLVDRADSGLRDGLLRALLAADAEPARVRDAFCSLLRHWGAAVFFGRVSPKQLAPALATALVAAALDARTDASKLTSVFEQLPIEAALRSAGAHPQLLGSWAQVIERRIHADPVGSGPLLSEFVAAGAAAARIVGRVLIARQGSGFGPEALKATLKSLVRAGLGAEFVLPLWEARSNATHVRLGALFALDGDKKLLGQALARRVGNLLEPAEIREALEELRWKAP